MESGTIRFGAPIDALVSPAGGALRPMPLVPSSPRECRELDSLRAIPANNLFDRGEIVSPEDARCVRAGLFLYFGALDESHRISQGIHTQSGSYWHGIMHRQEGDWSNAKYWFRRTGIHAVFEELERETGERWDPFAFVNLCRKAASGGPGTTRLEGQQLLEWRLLMEHCCRQALGA